MLKNRLKELAKKGDNSTKLEIIKESGLGLIKGGLVAICGKLTTCGWNHDTCPNLTDCTWNS
jgi:hypothetical protein